MSFDEEARQSAEALVSHLGRAVEERLQEFVTQVLDGAEQERRALAERVEQAEQALASAAEERQSAADRFDQALAAADRERLALAERHDQAVADAVATAAQERQLIADQAQQAITAAEQTLQDAVARAREDALAEATARLEAEQADRDAAAERDAIERQTAERETLLAGMERLVTGFRRLDEGQSLSQLLDVLAEQAALEASRCALFVVRGRMLQGWSLSGFAGAPTDPRGLTIGLDIVPEFARIVAQGGRAEVQTASFASLDAEPLAFINLPSVDVGVAVPVSVGGQVAAIVYVDDGGREDRPVPASWPEAIELLARHAARCLEAQTAIRAARLSNANAAGARPQPLRAVGGTAVPTATATAPTVAAVTSTPPAPALVSVSATQVESEPASASASESSASSASESKSESRNSEAYAEEHARRYARLLIADIRLYNEAAVRTGREQRDLGSRLQSEIARARQAFEERVPSTVAQRDRLFDEELVRTLADGDESLLGLETQGTQPESLAV